MSTFKKALHEIDNGRLGLNNGIDFGLKKLSQFIPGIQPKRFTTLAAGSGVGKTSLAIFMYIYSAYEALLKDPTIDYKCIFYTMEIDKVSVLSKLISIKLFKDYKILVDSDLIFSRHKDKRLSDEVYKLILENANYFERLEDIVEFIDVPTNPTGISKKVQEVMLDCGTAQYYNSNKERCSKDDADKTTFEYTPKNPQQIRLFLLDHSDCIKKEKDASTSKDKIDLFCEKAVYSRNKYGTSFTVLSQLNRGLDNAERQMHNTKNKNYELLLPQPSDLKGTGNLYESSDIVIYGFNPHNYSIPEFMGYDISKLKDRFRLIGIMKNRYGISNIQAGYGYLGESSFFADIPSPDKMTESQYNQLINLK